MLTRADTLPASAQATMGDEESAINLRMILDILWRQRWFIAICAAVGLILAIAYLLIATPMYSASATLLLDTQVNNFLQKQNIVADTTVDTGLVDSQVEVLTSDGLALQVIRNLDLTNDPEFVGPPTDLPGIIMGKIGDAVKFLQSEVGLNETKSDGANTPEHAAADYFQRHLTAKRVGLTYVITIEFSSKSPKKAQVITNAVARAYIDGELDAKFASTKQASTWLSGRLSDLSKQAIDAERAVQQFKQDNSIVDTGRGSMNQQQLADLNTQLITAKGATAEAKARLDRVQSVDKNNVADTTVSDALNNTVIVRLRAQLHDLQSKVADIAARVGPNHAAVKDLRQQVDEKRRALADEVQRIAAAYESDYEIAKAHQDSLETSLNGLVGVAGTSGVAEVKLHDLTSKADSYRTLYDSFLQKFQEAVQQQSSPVTNTRIIAEAMVPTKKSSPKSLLLIAAGLFLGLCAGTGTGFVREIWTDTFKTSDQVMRGLGVPCLGILPAVSLKASQGKGSQSGAGQPIVLEEYVLRAPFSRYTETLRNVKVSLDGMAAGRGKVTGVVSTLPQEGKTTIACNLATLLAVNGSRTLLIDGDLHQRTISRLLAAGAKEGLMEALAVPSRLGEIVHKRPQSGLDVLACVMERRTQRAADVLASTQMERLLAAAREDYDYIIIELAPIVPVVDAKAAARLIDHFVYVVEWGRSSRGVVSEALSETEAVRDRLSGVVLSRADPVQLRQIETSQGKSYGNYYVEI